MTGPTGSGKTTTLYAALNELNRPDRKIITAEDPVEYYLPGINQVEVKHNIGLDFARIIRAMLRQAPNIILVGEMRDTETAEMAIQASLTGHLVFSTLHTNDAPSAITRLIDIGVQPFLVASSRHGDHGPAAGAGDLLQVQAAVQAARPQICRRSGITPEHRQKATFMKGKGCNHCNKTGYRGRMGIFELMTMTSKIRELTFKGEPTQDDPQGGPQAGHAHALRGRHEQGAQGHHDAGRSPPHHATHEAADAEPDAASRQAAVREARRVKPMLAGRRGIDRSSAASARSIIGRRVAEPAIRRRRRLDPDRRRAG